MAREKGDKVEKGDPIVELETDKVNVEVNSDFSGVITEILSEEGDDVSVGDTIASLDENGEAGGSTAPAETPKEEKQEEAAKEQPVEAPKAPEANSEKDHNNSEVIASPAARKRARELNIDLSKVNARIRSVEFVQKM